MTFLLIFLLICQGAALFIAWLLYSLMKEAGKTEHFPHANNMELLNAIEKLLEKKKAEEDSNKPDPAPDPNLEVIAERKRKRSEYLKQWKAKKRAAQKAALQKKSKLRQPPQPESVKIAIS